MYTFRGAPATSPPLVPSQPPSNPPTPPYLLPLHPPHRRVPRHRPVPRLHARPRALQAVNLHRHDHTLADARRPNHQRIHLALGEKCRRRAPLPAVEEDLEDTPVDHPQDGSRGVERLIAVGGAGGEFVREEGVCAEEVGGHAAVEEEVAREEDAAAQGLGGAGGEEGEVDGAHGVLRGGGDGADGDVEGQSAAGDEGAVGEEDGGVAEAAVGEEGASACVERGEIDGVGDEVIACIADGGGDQHVLAREGHARAPVLEGTRGHDLRVLPVAGPGDTDGWRGSGEAVEELAGVVIFSEVGYPRSVVDGGEVGTVEIAGEVLGYRAAEGSAGVDADLENVGWGVWACGGEVGGGEGTRGVEEAGDRDEVRALVLQT